MRKGKKEYQKGAPMMFLHVITGVEPLEEHEGDRRGGGYPKEIYGTLHISCDRRKVVRVRC